MYEVNQRNRWTHTASIQPIQRQNNVMKLDTGDSPADWLESNATLGTDSEAKLLHPTAEGAGLEARIWNQSCRTPTTGYNAMGMQQKSWCIASIIIIMVIIIPSNTVDAK
jgi:hypothetical protein